MLEPNLDGRAGSRITVHATPISLLSFLFSEVRSLISYHFSLALLRPTVVRSRIFRRGSIDVRCAVCVVMRSGCGSPQYHKRGAACPSTVAAYTPVDRGDWRGPAIVAMASYRCTVAAGTGATAAVDGRVSRGVRAPE